MSASLEQFGPLVADARFAALDPEGKADFREKAFTATVGIDPERRAIFEQLPPERQAKLHDAFTSRFDSMYRSSFTVDMGPPVKKKREVSMEPGVAPIVEQYEETPRRPVLDVMTERFLTSVREGKVDPSKMDKATTLKTGALVSAYAPAYAPAWRKRAEEIATQEFLPENDTARPFVASAAIGASGALGPAVRITDWISKKTGLRDANDPLFQQSFQALNPENQELLSLAYPELSGSKTAGAVLALGGIGLRTASALQSAGINLVSKAGIAADAAITGAAGAAYGPEAPGIIASLADKPDSYVLNAIEAALFSSVVGFGMREATKAQLLTKVRDTFRFTRADGKVLEFPGSDEELIDYLRRLYQRQPKQVSGTSKPVERAADAAGDTAPPRYLTLPEGNATDAAANAGPAVKPTAPEVAPPKPADAAPVEVVAKPVEPEAPAQLPTEASPALAKAAPEVTPEAPGQPSSVVPDPPATSTAESLIVNVPVRQIPRGEIALRPDLMQFKRMVNAATGEAEHHKETIGGKWDDIAAGNLLLWEPNDPASHKLAKGEKYIVADGHGRVNYRDRSSPHVKGFNAQIIREADGYSAQDALILAAEKNIKDGKGSIYDQTRFLRNEAATRGQAEAVARAKDIGLAGRKSATIAFSSGSNVYDAFINEQITPEAAEQLSLAAPGSDALQRVGLAAILKGGSIQDASNLIRAAAASRPDHAEVQGDLFGADDSAMRAMEKQAKRASGFQSEISQDIRAIQGAARNPEVAAKYGVDVKDKAALAAKLDELKSERERWQNWHLHSDLVARTRGEEPPAVPAEAPPPAAAGDELFGAQETPFNLAGEQQTARPSAIEADEAARKAAADKAAEDAKQGSMFDDEPPAPSKGGGVEGNVSPAPEAGVGGDLGTPKARTRKATVAPEDDRDAVAFVIELPEMVQLGKALLDGKYPKVVENLRALKGRALGVMRHTDGEGGTASIELRADIFDLVSEQEKRLLKQQAVEYAQAMAALDPKADAAAIARAKYEQLLADAYNEARKHNPKLASKVLAHEIAHVVDWLPEKMIQGRGNLFGRIASLKNYTKSILPNKPGAPGKLTEADRSRLHREAAKLADAERTKAGVPDDVDPGITPEEILEIWQSTTARDKDPGLYDYVSKLTREQKKLLVKAAMRGKVADWFVFRRDQLPNLTKSEQEFYAELLKEEIRIRRLFDLQEMKNQLRPLIAWWRGTKEMEEYFEPPAEMYAEALSVLLNNPAAVAKRAPAFYEAFFNYLERKPQVKAIYSKIQDDIKSGQIYRDRVVNLRQSWADADDAGLKIEQMSAKMPMAERMDVVRLTFDRVFGPVYRRIKQAPDIPSEKVEKAIEDFIYRSTTHEHLLRQVNHQVLGQLHDHNLDWVDLGEYMFHQHVINNRENIASSQGFNPKASGERISEMAAELGAERFAALEFSRANLRSIYEEVVIRRLREADVLDPKLLALISERAFYATMATVRNVGEVPVNSIEAALQGRYGANVSARIYKQIGYLGDIKNPATATVQKGMSLTSMAYEQQAKREIVEFLLASGDTLVAEAPMRFTGSRREPVEVVNDRIGTLTFLHKGKVRAYYVPRAIYDAFENGSPVNSMIMAAIYKFVSPIKALYTELNYGFWPVAFYRDVAGFANRLPGASRLFGKGAFAKYAKDARQAAKASFTGAPNKLADEALRRQLVISRAQPRGESVADDALERTLLRFGIDPESWRDENLTVGKKLVEAWSWYKRQGQINERTVKIAGMMHLDEHFPSMAEVIKQRIIHEAAGSPNFLQRPQAGPLLDLFFLFYNPAKEGWRAEKRAWQRDPASRFAKFALYTAAGSMVMYALENGLLEEAIGKKDSDELREMYLSISEYDKTNYHIVPLGWYDKQQKKVLYLRIPLEESDRVMNGLLRKSLTSGQGGQGILSYAGGQVPGMNPVLTAISNWWTFKVLGKNPYDSMRGREVIPQTVFEAGQGDEALAKKTFNDLSAGLVMRITDESLSEPPKGALEKFLRAPFISNLLGRWIKISNRGIYDDANEIGAPVRKERAEMRLIGQEIVRKIKAGDGFTDSEKQLLQVNGYLLDYVSEKLTEAMVQQTSPEVRILLNIASKQEREAVQEAWERRK